MTLNVQDKSIDLNSILHLSYAHQSYEGLWGLEYGIKVEYEKPTSFLGFKGKKIASIFQGFSSDYSLTMNTLHKIGKDVGFFLIGKDQYVNPSTVIKASASFSGLGYGVRISHQVQDGKPVERTYQIGYDAHEQDNTLASLKQATGKDF